ncbi:GNAT family N-acetyltransferase [Paenibacillus sp. FJAT-26967]|uniref:GNAT family N-acetyltransferase n=1 Tax=Paenibacillus sp. FJAT-26967 TaxID=1729690 RepID=UPI0008393AD0|nr:GNAT family N-acetyltransferase [Paenibacillus sp. FJAT-26967]
MNTIVTTCRLILREYEESDYEDALRIFSNPQTMSFWPEPFGVEQVRKWMVKSASNYKEFGYGRWVTALIGNNKMIGDCGFGHLEINGKVEVDLGYIIDHRYWKQGYGAEAAQACLDYGQSRLGFNRIVANMPYNHTASRKTAEKLGMKKELEFVNERNRNILTCLYSTERDLDC